METRDVNALMTQALAEKERDDLEQLGRAQTGGPMTDLQRQMLCILLLDFGYDHEPLYGHTLLRHQFAWKLATDGVDAAELAQVIADMKAGAEREGKPFVSFADRAIWVVGESRP